MTDRGRHGRNAGAGRAGAGVIDPDAADPVVVVLLRSALDDDWTACRSVRRVEALGVTSVQVRRSRARILRGSGERPGPAARRALVAADALVLGGDPRALDPSVCERCGSLRSARCTR
jgi:hypothetical protein